MPKPYTKTTRNKDPKRQAKTTRNQETKRATTTVWNKETPKKGPLKSGGLKRKKEPTGEKEMFEKISKTRCVCEVCRKKIKTFKTWCFAHLLPKGTYPKYRLYENNIAVVCSLACHKEVDRRVAGNKYEIEQQIKNGFYIDISAYDGKHNPLLKDTE